MAMPFTWQVPEDALSKSSNALNALLYNENPVGNTIQETGILQWNFLVQTRDQAG